MCPLSSVLLYDTRNAILYFYMKIFSCRVHKQYYSSALLTHMLSHRILCVDATKEFVIIWLS